MKTRDEMGDRLKDFEGVESDRRFMPLLPICVRLDGKCFSKFTKGLNRPFDERFHAIMVDTTRRLVSETNALVGYTQSDEISLIYYSDRYDSQVFFDGRIQKMTSVLAAMCSVYFNHMVLNIAQDLEKLSIDKKDIIWSDKYLLMPVFDCRSWNVPSKMEATNTILWREMDATKNAISMAARHYFSHKELMDKHGGEMQEMLFQKGINFNDYPDWFKRGTFIQRKKKMTRFSAEELEKLPAKHEAKANPDLMIERSVVEIIRMPQFSKVINRVEVIFDGAEPLVSAT